MTRFAIVLALVAGATACKKTSEHTPKPSAVTMSAAEIKRSQDACAIYVEKICACTTTRPELAKQCDLAKALPDAVRVGLEVAASPDSKPDIVEQSYASVRKTVAECIEQTAKLPALGCP